MALGALDPSAHVLLRNASATSPAPGGSWVAPPVTLDPARWRALAASADASVLVAAAYGSTPLYVLRRGGQTWQAAGAGNALWASVAASANGQVLLAGAHRGQLARSTDGGINWAAAGPSAPSDGIYAVAVAGNGAKLAAAQLGGAVWVSDDAGASWSRTYPNNPSNTNAPADGVYNAWSALAASPSGNLLVASHLTSVWVSRDWGASWRSATPAAAADATRFTVNFLAVGDGGAVAAVLWDREGGPGSVYHSTDSGTQWTLVGSGKAFRSVALRGQNRLVVAAEGSQAGVYYWDKGTGALSGGWVSYS
jgi:hypothetical protein